MTDSDATGPSLTEELRRLEEIVRRLESDDTDLDQALALFGEGVERLRAAQVRLEEAQGAVERVVADAAGALGTEPLDGP
jgi:exodeoxyribonuclease VII small subunit